MTKRFCDKCGIELKGREDYKQIYICYQSDRCKKIEEFPDYCNICADLVLKHFLNFTKANINNPCTTFIND